MVSNPLWAAVSEEMAVHKILEAWHQAASEAKEDEYFSGFAKDAVFLGTDPKERWTKLEFRKWAHPIFAKGGGWTIRANLRRVYFSSDRKTAWFDEEAESKELGAVRGSGVLVKEKGAWKIAQYNLSVPILNERFAEIRKINREKPAK